MRPIGPRNPEQRLSLRRNKFDSILKAVLGAAVSLGVANAQLLGQNSGELSGGWGVVGNVPSSAAGSFSSALAIRASLLLHLPDNPSARFDALLLQVNRQFSEPQPCPTTGCTQANVTRLKSTIAGVSANAIFNLDSQGTLYAVAGAGGYDENILSDEYHLGLTAGIGFALPAGSRVRVVGEAQWLAIIGGTAGPTSMAPITLGIRF
jgi:hypothetical protein